MPLHTYANVESDLAFKLEKNQSRVKMFLNIPHINNNLISERKDGYHVNLFIFIFDLYFNINLIFVFIFIFNSYIEII